MNCSGNRSVLLDVLGMITVTLEPTLFLCSWFSLEHGMSSRGVEVTMRSPSAHNSADAGLEIPRNSTPYPRLPRYFRLAELGIGYSTGRTDARWSRSYS